MCEPLDHMPSPLADSLVITDDHVTLFYDMGISLEPGQVHVTSSHFTVLCSRRHNSLVNRTMALWLSVFDT